MMSSSSSFLLSHGSAAAAAAAAAAVSISSPSSSSSIFRWRLQSKQLAYTGPQKSIRRALRVVANANAPQGKRKRNDVVMVDPLEAKRLAAKQMQEIQAKEKLERQRRIEAINGAWAMIGLTTGLVIEGQTGNGILAQVVGYFKGIVNFLAR